MPWFHLSHVLAAGTEQFTTPSWPLWMFSFENYVDQSLDRRRKLIGMRLGMRFFLYGVNGSKFLLQMHTLKHGPTSHSKTIGIRPSMLPLYLHIGGFNVCYRGIFLVLVAWAVHRHTWESKLHGYCRYASLGSWREVDDVVWNSHLASFLNFCRM